MKLLFNIVEIALFLLADSFDKRFIMPGDSLVVHFQKFLKRNGNTGISKERYNRAFVGARGLDKLHKVGGKFKPLKKRQCRQIGFVGLVKFPSVISDFFS